MPAQKDRPDTWVKFTGNSFCKDCIATCCTMPLEVSVIDLIRLGLTDEEEAASGLNLLGRRLQKQGKIKRFNLKTGIFMIPSKPNGDCSYLDSKTRLCTVYDIRPRVCREFPKTVGSRKGFCPKILKNNRSPSVHSS